ncbi:MAG: FAD-binding oxidoreductase [Actinomycetes bacterium]
MLDELVSLLPGRVHTGEAVMAHGQPWNVAYQPEAQAVVEAHSAEDIAVGLRWAARAGVPVGILSTGHGAVDSCRGGLLISVGSMNDVAVDPVERTARVGAGAKWAAVLTAAAEHGLAGLAGSTGDVSAVGFLTGGGVPVLSRTYGFAADHVRSMTVVTPDGAIRTCSAESEPDLFWAVRGGKGNFGIVTEAVIDLFNHPTIFGGAIAYPGVFAEPVLRGWRSWCEQMPEEMNSSIALMRFPDAPMVPEPLRGQFVVTVRVAYAGDPMRGAELAAPLRDLAVVVSDELREMPYVELDTVHHDPTDPLPAYARGAALASFGDDTIDALLAVAGPGVETPVLMVEVRHLGGALGRPGPGAASAAGRDAAWNVYAVGVLAPPIAAIVPGACAAVVGALEPWRSQGNLVHFLGDGLTDADVAACWDADSYARLAAVKAAVDPEQVMAFGYRILPAAAGTLPAPRQAVEAEAAEEALQ